MEEENKSSNKNILLIILDLDLEGLGGVLQMITIYYMGKSIKSLNKKPP